MLNMFLKEIWLVSDQIMQCVFRSPFFNMFHVFALTYTYYNLLRCVTREYSMTSVTMKNYSIYVTCEYTTTNDEKYSIYATHEYTTIFDMHDAYYSLLARYMKHVFVAGLVTGDLFLTIKLSFTQNQNLITFTFFAFIGPIDAIRFLVTLPLLRNALARLAPEMILVAYSLAATNFIISMLAIYLAIASELHINALAGIAQELSCKKNSITDAVYVTRTRSWSLEPNVPERSSSEKMKRHNKLCSDQCTANNTLESFHCESSTQDIWMLDCKPKFLQPFGNFWKNFNTSEKIDERVKKILENFTLNSKKVYRKSVEFQN